MVEKTVNIIKNKPEGESFNKKTELNYTIINGLISFFPSFIGHNYSTNFYKLGQSIDRVCYRLRETLYFYKFLLTIDRQQTFFSFSNYLDNVGRSLGLNRLLNEPDINYINRLINLNNQIIIGATEEELIKAIYYFIGQEAFTVMNQEIYITDRADLSDEVMWSDNGGTNPQYNWYDELTWDENDSSCYKWNTTNSFSDEDYQITIKLVSGSEEDRKTKEYWSKEENLSLLQELVSKFNTVGKIFIIKIIERV